MAKDKTTKRNCYRCKVVTEHIDTVSVDKKTQKKDGIDSVCLECGAPSFYPAIFIR